MIFKYALPAAGLGYLLFGLSRQLVYARMGIVRTDDDDALLNEGKRLNMGQIEEGQEEREHEGRKRDKMYDEGLKMQQSSF